MEGARIVSISELLKIGRPLTGASSLSLHRNSDRTISACCSVLSQRIEGGGRSFVEEEGEPVPPRAFRSLNFATVVVGTLGLSDDYGSSRGCNSGNRCFSFSDGTGRVCCAVLDLDIAILGRKICVHAWNFVPISRDRGLLEIIKWSLPERASEPGDHALPSSPPHFPQKEGCQRVRSCAWGVVIAVSTVFSVPCSSREIRRNEQDEAADGAYSEGFLAEINTCRCESCGKAKSVKDLLHTLIDRNIHTFDKPVFVYFHGPRSSWRPILAMLSGIVITVSGLKKKYISAGGSESLIFVATESTIVHEHGKPMDQGLARRTAISGTGGQIGSYCGVVSGIFKNGMLVELDERNVWLLLAGSLLDLPHSLRVGAVITVKNAIFIRPKFSWIKVLLLGSFIKTSIEVKSFSAIDCRAHSSCRFIRRSRRLLWDYIDSLPFYARFWALLLASSFQRKFARLLSDEEIMGTMKKEGLVENYCRLTLPVSSADHQRGAFMDFCGHHHESFMNDSNDVSLLMAAPLSNFMGKCMKIWMSKPTKTTRDMSYVDQYHHRMVKMIISSEELALALVGFLQVSPCSGRLQLMDSTGCVDVMMSALPRHFDPHVLYEVKEYEVVLCGFPLQVDHILLDQIDPLSCRNILRRFRAVENRHSITIYIHLETRNLRSLNIPAPRPSLAVDLDKDGRFDLLVVTHKFSRSRNIVWNRRSCFFAEAVLLPFSLIIKQKYVGCSTDPVLPCVISFKSGGTHDVYLLPKEKTSALHHDDGGGGDDDDDDDDHLHYQDWPRILLEFEQEGINSHQRLCIGEPYITKCPRHSPKVLVNSQSTLCSVDLLGGKGQRASEGVRNDRLFHHCPDSMEEHVDARVHLSEQGDTCPKEIKSLESCLRKARSMLGEVFSVCSLIERGFPERGELVSLRGDVTLVHISRQRENPNGSDRDLCVHVCDGPLMVKVRATWRDDVRPLGFGPGANVTFHRVLVLADRKDELVMIPVSCVVVNYVRRLDLPRSSDWPTRDDFSGMGPLTLISELTLLADKTRVDLCCRVAGTFLFVLDDRGSDPGRSASAVRVALAGFLLDDGSSLCCCWADSDRARTMLRLEEDDLLRMMLRKHRAITVRSFGAKVDFDSSLADLTFSVDSGGELSGFDRDLLKLVLLHARNGPNLNVAGHVLNSDELTCLDVGFSQTDLAKDSVKHIWATAVDISRPLTEARNLIRDLTRGGRVSP